MPLELTFYTAATAPHMPVPELSGGKARHRHTHIFDSCTSCRAHFADPSKPGCRVAVCAACNWNAPAVAKLRASKRRRLNAELKRKTPASLVPPVEFAPLFPRGFDAAAVILPHIPLSDGFSGCDTLDGDVAGRYLAAMGFRCTTERVHDGDDVSSHWACGCMTGEHNVTRACAQHRPALVDGAPGPIELSA